MPVRNLANKIFTVTLGAPVLTPAYQVLGPQPCFSAPPLGMESEGWRLQL